MTAAVTGGAPACISVFAGRVADTGIDPVLLMATAVEILRIAPNAELIWASPRELLNVFKADEIGCHIITVTNDILKKLSLVGRALDEYSLDTVKMFYRKQYGSNFISAMPTNLHGPHDNFNLTSSHVLPALMRRFHDAKRAGQREVTIWGTGTPTREFLHVDDLADACVFLMEHYDEAGHINIGTGDDLPISEAAHIIRESRLSRRRLDVRLLEAGWHTTKAAGRVAIRGSGMALQSEITGRDCFHLRMVS